MPVDKNISTYNAAAKQPKKGLKGSAGGDVRGYNTATHGYQDWNASGVDDRWDGADTDTEGPVDATTGSMQGLALGQTYFGPVQWVASRRWRKGDMCTYLAAEYKCIEDHDGRAGAPSAGGEIGVYWDLVSDVFGVRKNAAGEHSPYIVTDLATAASGGVHGAGFIKVTWTKPVTNTDLAGYELIAWKAEDDDPTLARWPGLSDPDDKLQADSGGGTDVLYKLVSADAAAQEYDEWDLTDFGAAAVDVVIGVRTYTDDGLRGPWVWIAATTDAA